jgi:hypothetical protein
LLDDSSGGGNAVIQEEVFRPRLLGDLSFPKQGAAILISDNPAAKIRDFNLQYLLESNPHKLQHKEKENL